MTTQTDEELALIWARQAAAAAQQPADDADARSDHANIAADALAQRRYQHERDARAREVAASRNTPA